MTKSKISNEPIFIYSNRCYYDINNNTIYADEKYSFNYWHEYRHFKLNSNPTIRKLNLKLSEFTQFFFMILPIYFLIFIKNISRLALGTFIFIMIFMIPATFTLLQEIDADIFALIKIMRKEK